MAPILRQHSGVMEGDMVEPPVVLEVVTHGAMEEHAMTEGIEEKCEKNCSHKFEKKCEKTQICHEL